MDGIAEKRVGRLWLLSDSVNVQVRTQAEQDYGEGIEVD